jgi:hypothetical protein
LLSAIEPRPVEWLWRDRIPLGELTLVDGDPGTNKSSVTLELAARVSTGREMPDGTPGLAGTVLLIVGEDSIPKTLRQRLQAAGADLKAGFAMRTVERAKDALGVRSQRRGFGPGSSCLWELAGVVRNNGD